MDLNHFSMIEYTLIFDFPYIPIGYNNADTVGMLGKSDKI